MGRRHRHPRAGATTTATATPASPCTGRPPVAGASPAGIPVAWGKAGDIPTPGDFDEDGDTDIVEVFRPSTEHRFPAGAADPSCSALGRRAPPAAAGPVRVRYFSSP